MNPDLSQFIGTVLRVVFATLFVVASVAFITLPYAFGGHPGEAQLAGSAYPKHMT